MDDIQDHIRERKEKQEEKSLDNSICHTTVLSTTWGNSGTPLWSGSPQELAEGCEEAESLQNCVVALQVSQNEAWGCFCAF